MKYRVDKKANRQLSMLGFGCMRFPRVEDVIDLNLTEQLICEAVARGINYFDTALIYPGSEEALGAVLKKNPHLRQQMYIATKLPISKCVCYEDFDKFFSIQKERLHTEHIDYYFMHAMRDARQWRILCKIGIEKWIEQKKQSGEIGQVGFSFHGEQENFMELLDAYDWDFCQIQYNYLNEHYQAGVEGLRRAAEKGMTVMIMEPLLGGKLAEGVPEEAVDLFRRTDARKTPVAWALNWLWNQPEITVVLSGMNSMEQLQENTQLADQAEAGMLGEKEHKVIKQVVEVFNQLYKVPCTGCGYCLPCPKKIDIPSCFAAYNASYVLNEDTGQLQYILSTSALRKDRRLASSCVKCGKCLEHCPQHIRIPDELVQVSERLEPEWIQSVDETVQKALEYMK
jgi:predicted aldo/keto reductase-like oxidoreductase